MRKLQLSIALFLAVSPIARAEYKDSLLENQTRALVHRFWSLYETSDRDPAPHLELVVDEGLDIRSGEVAYRSHADLTRRVQSLPSEMKNSHQVRRLTVTPLNGGGGTRFLAQVLYQTQMPGGPVSSNMLSYEGKTVRGDDGNLRIKSVSITPIETVEGLRFKDIYQTNRIYSFVHHWFSQFDRNDRSADRITPLVAGENLTMVFPFGTLTSRDQVAAWLPQIIQNYRSTAHHVQEITYKPLGENRYRVDFDLHFQSVSVAGALDDRMLHHYWIIRDGGGRYPEIQEYHPEPLAQRAPSAKRQRRK